MKKVIRVYMIVLMIVICSSTTFAADVAKVGKKTYSTLQSAVNHAKKGQTIKVLSPIKTKKSVIIKESVIIDFARVKYSFTGSGEALIIKAKSVQLKGMNIVSASGAVWVNRNAKAELKSGKVKGAVTNDGSLVINGGHYTGNGYVGDYVCPAIINNGSMAIKQGTFTGTKRMLIWNHGTAVISGGSFNAKKAPAIETYKEGKLTIKDGSFQFTPGSDTEYLISNYGTTKIFNGTFMGCVYNSCKGKNKMVISGGSFRSFPDYLVIRNDEGSLNITGGSFSTTRYNTVINDPDGVLNISGGSFLTKSEEQYYCIYNEGKLILTGGTFKTNNDSNKCIGCLSTSEWWVTGSAEGTVEIRD